MANHQHTPLSKFFIVQVIALVKYEEKEEQFKVGAITIARFSKIGHSGCIGMTGEV